jgi:hypothetical protein
VWTHCIVIAPPRSKVSSASSSDSKTCAFRHSARSRALNDLMCALSVGFPVGRCTVS